MVKWGYISEQNSWWKFERNYEQKDRELQALINTYDPEWFSGHEAPDQAFGLKARKGIDHLELKSGNIFLIKGPRRVGKTTYMKQIIRILIKERKVAPSDILYLNVDGLKINTSQHLRRALRNYFEIYPEDRMRYVFIDEITSCRGWEDLIQGESDVGKLGKAVTFLTGSDPKHLEEGGHKLSGRGVSGNEYLARPFTFRDFITFVLNTPNHATALRMHYGLQEETQSKILRLDQFSLNDDKEKIKKVLFGQATSFENELALLFSIYLKTGGFPEAIGSYFSNLLKTAQKDGSESRPNIDSKIYEDVLRAILEKLSAVGKEPKKAEKILDVISDLKAATGTSTYAGIASQAQTNSQTAEEYIENLRKWMLVDVIGNYQREGYLKKIYIADPFILHSIRSKSSGRVPYDHSEELLEKEEEKGMLVECLAGSLIRASEEQPIMREPETFLYFYNSGKNEVDFIFKRQDGTKIGIEIKYQEEPQTSEIYTENCDFAIALTKNETEIGAKIWQIPCSVFFALLIKSDKHL